MRVIDADRTKEITKLAGQGALPAAVMRRAEKIFDEVEKKGDPALFKWTRELEGHRLTKKTVKVSRTEMDEAVAKVPAADMRVIRTAARRIKAYHKEQKPKGFRYNDGRGTAIEERVVPLARVGLCIPGGRAPLASTVLMTAIPARLAGVGEVVMISPWPGGKGNPHVLLAARIAGVDAIYKIGGAQGVAALACSTESVPRADKVVGPGSVWVTAAKSIAAARGLCGIESPAGPSEVVVLADASADPRLVAVDLISQAEHGADSFAVLVTTSKRLIKAVDKELARLFAELGVKASQAKKMERQIVAVTAAGMGKAAAVVNQIAPEHLEIMTREPNKVSRKINNAASVFIGPYSPVPAGDYMAGANHVLPTAGAARFASPLSVHDFVKRVSVTTLSKGALAEIAEPTARFAEIEGLDAHAKSVRARFKR